MENKVSWKSLEYKKKEKTADWYWAVIIIAISIVVVSFLVGDGFFGILIIVATMTLLMFSTHEPKLLDIMIDQRGLIINTDMYPFVNLDAFWVDISDPNNHKIIFESKKTFMPLVVIPLDEYHHLDIRDFLLQYLPEKEMHEPVSQKIMEKLGF
jgi:hypothetical protein